MKTGIVIEAASVTARVTVKATVMPIADKTSNTGAVTAVKNGISSKLISCAATHHAGS